MVGCCDNNAYNNIGGPCPTCRKVPSSMAPISVSASFSPGSTASAPKLIPDYRIFARQLDRIPRQLCRHYNSNSSSPLALCVGQVSSLAMSSKQAPLSPYPLPHSTPQQALFPNPQVALPDVGPDRLLGEASGEQFYDQLWVIRHAPLLSGPISPLSATTFPLDEVSSCCYSLTISLGV